MTGSSPTSWRARAIFFFVVTAALVSAQSALAQTSIFAIQRSPSPNIFGNTINAVAALSSSEAWAVGYQNDNNLNDSRTLAEHWNGTSWTVVKSPNPGSTPNCQNSNTGNFLNAVAYVSASDVWGVGFFFPCNGPLRPMALHWDGTQWKPVRTPALNTNDNAVFNSVVAFGANDVYAVGYQPATNGAVQTLIEHWDGTNWTVMTSPNPSATGNTLTAVAGTSASDLWAVGTSTDAPTTSIQTLTLHFNGTSWAVVPSPNPLPKQFLNQNVFQSLTATSSSDVTAAGYLLDSASFRFLTFVEHWNGTAWTVSTTPNPSSGAGDFNVFRGVSAVSANNIYAVGYFANASTTGQQQTLIEHFDGVSWTIVSSPTKGLAQQLNGVFALPGSGNVWVGGAWAQHGDDPETGFLQQPKTLLLFTPIG